MSSVLYEGQQVTEIGENNSRGHIVMVAGIDSAHVKWTAGPNAGSMTLSDIYTLEPITAVQADDADDPLHLRAVASAYTEGGEDEVLNFLASHGYTKDWTTVAKDVLDFTKQKIRLDASMELVDEQLAPADQRKVVQAAALALLRDAFGPEVA